MIDTPIELMQPADSFDLPYDYKEGQLVVIRPMKDITWINDILDRWEPRIYPHFVNMMERYTGYVAVIDAVFDAPYDSAPPYVKWVELVRPNVDTAINIIENTAFLTVLDGVDSYTWCTPWMYPLRAHPSKTLSLWSPKRTHEIAGNIYEQNNS